jgi:hypothetical protein
MNVRKEEQRGAMAELIILGGSIKLAADTVGRFVVVSIED